VVTSARLVWDVEDMENKLKKGKREMKQRYIDRNVNGAVGSV
jgi:hypothetical protein